MKNFTTNFIKTLLVLFLLASANYIYSQTIIDAGIIEIHSPMSSHNEGDTIDVIAEFSNFGTDTIFAIDLAYVLNSGTSVVTSWTGVLAPTETDSVFLAPIIIPLGASEICVYTTLISDTIPMNDTMCLSFYGNPQNNAGAIGITDIPEIQGYYPIYAIIFNQGTLPLQSAIIEWGIDNISQTSYNWTGNIDQGNLSDPILLGYHNFNDSLFNIQINTSLPNGIIDPANANDTINLQLEFFNTAIVDTFPYCESFETTYDNWLQSTWDDYNWTQNSNGTPSWGTGPSAAFDGTYYMFTESNNQQAGDIASIEAMFDFTNFLYPEIVFNYNMNGTQMGVLHLDIFDTIWHNDVWTMSGNQNNLWYQANVGILDFGGMDQVVIRFRGERGSGNRSDMAIDNFCFNALTTNDIGVTQIHNGDNYLCSGSGQDISIELENFGALDQSNIPLEFIITDPLGNSATILDTIIGTISAQSSQLFTFTNISLLVPGSYDITCISHLSGDVNAANDTLSGLMNVIMSISNFPYNEDFETGNNNFKLESAFNAAIGIATDTILSNSFLRMTGGDSNQGWTGSGNNVTPQNAWVDNIDHIASALTCEIDATSLPGIMLEFDILQTNTFNYTDYCWFRVLVNDTIQVTDVNGVSNFNASTPISDPFHSIKFNLSQFAGTSFTLTLQASLKYNESYNGTYPDGDQVLIDNIIIYEPFMLDAMVTDIVDLNTSFCGSNNQYFNIMVGNNGISEISNFPVQVTVTFAAGTLTLTETVLDTLNNGDMTIVTVGPFDMAIADDYTIDALSMLTNDGDLNNDSFSTIVSTISGISTFPFVEEFIVDETDYLSFEDNSLSTVYFFNDNNDYVLRMEGGPTNTAWSGSGNNTTPTQAWGNTEHHGFARSCTIDASTMQFLNLDIDFRQTGIMTYLEYSWFRVLINDTIQIADMNGDMDFNPNQPQGDSYQMHTFNLNDYVSTEFTITLQSSCKYDSTMTNGGVNYIEGDGVYIRYISLYEPPAIDIKVNSIGGIPEPDCDLLTALITVYFMNNGTDTLFAGDVIPFNLGVNGMGFLEGYTLPIDLAYGDTSSYVFNAMPSLINDGFYDIVVMANYAGDTIADNNTAQGFTTNILTVNTFPYEQDFETNADGWTTQTISGNVNWELGTPQQTIINNAHSGISAWMTGLNVNYSDDAEIYLYSPCFDFTNVINPEISLWLNVDAEEDYDGMILEGSADNGTTWNKVGENDNTFYTSFNNAAGYPVIEFPWWTATFNSWVNFTTLALEYSGEPTVKFRFRFESDGSVNTEGVAMDDFSINDIMICEATASNYGVCMGESVILDVSVSGGIPPYSYAWSPVSSLSDPLIVPLVATPLSTTQYTVIVTDTNGSQASAFVTIEVFIPPVVELGPDISSPTAVTLDAGAGHASYIWSTGYDQQFLIVEVTGEYSVTVVDDNGCEGYDDITVSILSSIDGIETNKLINIYPNPADDKVYIELLERLDDVKVLLTDITGKILSINAIESGNNHYELIISDLAAGTYLITIQNSNITIVKKLLVE